MRIFIKTLQLAMLSSVCILAQASYGDELSDALKMKMDYLSQNQAVISKNIANANTPKYKALELKEPSYLGAKRGVGLATTSPMHISGIGRSGKFAVVKQKDTYETAPNGNNVSLEEQMVKMSKNSAEHQATTNLIRKVNSLVNLATGER